MHAFLAAAWPWLLTLAGLVAGAAVTRLKVWRASPAAAQHPIEEALADVAISVSNDALALLRSNPALKPTDVISWAEQELQAQAASAVGTVGVPAVSMGINELVRRNLLSVAQGGHIDDAASAIISALAPTAATAKVTPPQIAAVLADAATAAPNIEAAIVEHLPEIIKALEEHFKGNLPTSSTGSGAPTVPVSAAA